MRRASSTDCCGSADQIAEQSVQMSSATAIAGQRQAVPSAPGRAATRPSAAAQAASVPAQTQVSGWKPPCTAPRAGTRRSGAPATAERVTATFSRLGRSATSGSRRCADADLVARARSECPELVRREAEGGREQDRHRLRLDAARVRGDERDEEDLVQAEREARDEQGAEALAEPAPAARRERPGAIPEEVVHRCDEERDRRRREVVHPEGEQRPVDAEVDDVPGAAHEGEAQELSAGRRHALTVPRYRPTDFSGSARAGPDRRSGQPATSTKTRARTPRFRARRPDPGGGPGEDLAVDDAALASFRIVCERVPVCAPRTACPGNAEVRFTWVNG